MAEINASPVQGGKKRPERQLRVDMTPMVDLGFLLITFFIFTTVAQSPQTLKLVLPVDGPSTLTGKTKTLTVLLNEPGKAVCYKGIASEKPPLQHVSMAAGSSELRKVILAKQRLLKQHTGTADSLVVVIKPGQESHYQQLIAVLDEMAICEVKKHVVAEPDADDHLLLSSE
ncbi:MAG: biopolymer transporter ExbD [Chitinophagaceae bacterium]|nr:biopolymer transporter ExbD [Chitinophagaceae bacterium]MCW5925381.1 biopolymer transporter ExbD [Chitinophagaceae bacterium]